MVLASDCLRSTTAIADLPSTSATERCSSRPSSTSATSRTRTMAPLLDGDDDVAELVGAWRACALVRTTSSSLPRVTRPPGRSMLCAPSALTTSLTVRP